MKLKIITTVSTMENPGLHALSESMKDFDFKILHNPSIGWDWGGWDTHFAWLNSPEAQDYTHVIYTDGFDTLGLGTQKEAEEVLTKLLTPNPEAFIYSVEKHWFPYEAGWETDKPKFDSKLTLPDSYRWRYVNGGQYCGSVDTVKRWYTNAPKDKNNQAFANSYYANQTDNSLILDFGCELFQTLSHSGPNHGSHEEFTIQDKRLINNLTGSKPVFVHNNGIKSQAEAQFMYDILK